MGYRWSVFGSVRAQTGIDSSESYTGLMDWGLLLLLALMCVLGTIGILALSAAFRANRWAERQRGWRERIGSGLLGVLLIVIVAIILIATTQ